MKFTMTIDSDNDGCSTKEDIIALIKKVAVRAYNAVPDQEYNILDHNGSTVGHFTISDEDRGEEEEEEEEEEV